MVMTHNNFKDYKPIFSRIVTTKNILNYIFCSSIFLFITSYTLSYLSDILFNSLFMDIQERFDYSSYFHLIIEMAILGPLVETYILIQILNITMKFYNKNLKIIIIFLAFLWGGIHAYFVGLNAFFPVFFLFLYYYDTYLKFHSKKAFIVTWIVHGMSNLIAGSIAWMLL